MARVVSILVLLLSLSGVIAVAQDKPEALAEEAAGKWLALVDGGDYARSYQEAAEYFKNAVGNDQWQTMMHGSREPFGKVMRRKLKSATYATTLPGAPDGEYVVIQYDSSFEHKESATETVTPMLDVDGQWRVSGYFVK